LILRPLLLFLIGLVFYPALGLCYTIHVGLLLDLSGPGSFAGQAAAETARLAVEQLNRSKHGRNIQLELHILDTEGSRAILLENLKELTEVYRVTCIIGTVHPALARSLRIYSEANNKLAILTSGEEPLVPTRGGYPVVWSFGTFIPRTASMKALCRALKKNGISPVGIMAPQGAWGEQVALWLYGYASEFGLPVVGMEYYDLGDVDGVAQMRALKYKGAKLALVWGPRTWFSTLLHSSLEVGLPAAVPVNMIQSDEMDPLAATTGMISVLPPVVMDKWVPYGHPCRQSVRRYRQALFEQASFFSMEEHLVAGAVWDALNLLYKAALEAEHLTSYGIRDSLEKMQEPFYGVMGVFRPRKGDHVGLRYNSLIVAKRDGRRWRLLKKR